MPTGIQATGVSLGLLWFSFQAFKMVGALRFARCRNERLEAMGAVVPGLAGLLLAVAAVLPPSPVGLALSILAVPVLILGRAIYELAVFRHA